MHIHTQTQGRGDCPLPHRDRVPADAPALLRDNAYTFSLKGKPATDFVLVTEER